MCSSDLTYQFFLTFLIILFDIKCVNPLLGSIVFLCRNYLGGWFTDNEEVSAMVVMLIIPMLVYQLGDGMQINFANALRGISDVKPMMLIAFIAYFVISLPVGYFCGFVLNWGG